MFKNLTLHRIGPDWSATVAQLEAQLDKARFAECAATQAVSAGWVSPRGHAHGALVEAVDGHWLMTLMVEQKILPGAVVKRRTDELAQRSEHETGRKPGRKHLKELKEQAVQELLPMAFTKRASHRLWLDPQHRLLMVDAGSLARAGDVLTHLAKALDGLPVAPLQTAQSAAAAMAAWLADGEPPAAFSIDRECELKAEDESKSVVRYARHRLDTDEVRQHVAAGKRPTRLALTWEGRVSFVLTDAGQVKKLDFLDVVFENRPGRADAEEAFDADAAIATGELVKLIPDLVDALGGEQPLGGAAPAAAAANDTPARRAA